MVTVVVSIATLVFGDLCRVQDFCRRVVARESDIHELKMLSTSLLNYHHGNSHTNGLQEVMTTLTESYSRIKSK